MIRVAWPRSPRLPGRRDGGGRPGRALLVARVRMQRNGLARSLRRHRARTVLQTGVVAPVVLVVLVGLYAAAYAAFRGLADPADASAALSILFGLVVVGGFVGSASVALQALYLASDLPFLLSLPIPLRVTYGGKFAEAMLGTGPVAIVLVASLAGYATARGGDWLTIAVCLVVGLALLAMVTSFAVVVVAVIARYIPAKRARRFLALVSLLLVVLAWAFWAALAPDDVVQGVNDGAATGRLSLETARLGLGPTPLGWGARTVVAAGSDDGAALRLYGGAFAASALVVGFGAFGVFARTFTGGYHRVRAAAAPTPRQAMPRAARLLLAPLPRPLAALVLKEWLTMFRDLRRLSGAVWPLGMVAVYAVALAREESPAPVDTPGLEFWLSSGSLALVPWGASLGISIFAVGTERRNIHLLRSLPVRARTILIAKVLASLLPVLLAAEAAVAVVALAQAATLGQALGMAGIVAWAAVGYVVIDTASAAIAPNFEAEHVQRATTFFGRLVGFAAGAAFTVASAVAACRLVLFSTGTPGTLRPYLAWDIAGIEPMGWPLVVAAAGFAALAVVTVATIAVERLDGTIRAGS